MTAAINKTKLNNLADGIWKSAERLRGKFKAYEYQNVIQSAYTNRGRFEDLADPQYSAAGGIFDLMAYTVIQVHLAESGSTQSGRYQ